MLLDREDVDPGREDKRYGRTPLSWAAEHGHEGVVKMLLERGSANLNMADTLYGQTPLTWAAGNGHEGVVKMLLESTGINPDQADTQCGATPLSWASERGHEGVVKMLLQCGDVNPDRADTEYGRTPLSWAVWSGHEEIVMMLLEQNDVCTATPDNKNQTPGLLALSEGHDRVARILLERGNTNSVTADRGGQAALPPSTEHRVAGAVEMQPPDSPNTETTDFTCQPALQSTKPNEQKVVLDFKHPIPKSIESDLSTESSGVSQPPSIQPLEKIETHPRATKPILSSSIDRWFIISFVICLFAFLLYNLPSPLLDLSSFHKYFPGRELA